MLIFAINSLLGGGFKISPLKDSNGTARSQVQHLMQIDLKGWGFGYFPPFQQHCLLQMLNSVAGNFYPSILADFSILKSFMFAYCSIIKT